MKITKTVDEMSPALKSSIIMSLMGWTIKPAWLDRDDEWVIYNRAGRYLHKFKSTEPELMGMVDLYDKHLMWLAWEAHLWAERILGTPYQLWFKMFYFDQKAWLDYIVERVLEAQSQVKEAEAIDTIFDKLGKALVGPSTVDA